MAIYGLVIEAPQSESGGNTDRPIPNDGRRFLNLFDILCTICLYV